MTTHALSAPRRRDVRAVARADRTPAPWIAVVAAVIALLVDLTGRIALGPVSGSAAVTLGAAVALAALAPLLAGSRALAVIPWPLTAFVLYAIVRLFADFSMEGLQNIAVLTLFLLGIAFSARASSVERAGAGLVLLAGTGLATAAVFLAQAATGAIVYGTRSFALAALVLLAAAVATPGVRWWSRLAPIVIAGAVLASLSRTATVLAVLLLSGLVVRMRRGRRSLFAIAGVTTAGAGIWTLVTVFPPLRDRFLTGDNALEFGGIALNTSGRSSLWEAVIEGIDTSPLFGHGPGSAVQLVTARFAPIQQPHNDYLRLAHDYGYTGLAVFAAGVIWLLVRIARRAVVTDRPVHWAALFALVAVLLAAATDNVFVYPFAMLPLAVLIGLSLGLPARE